MYQPSFSCISITVVWWNATSIFHQAAVYTRYVTACDFSLSLSCIQQQKIKKGIHTRTFTQNKPFTSHSSWFILINILYILCFTRSTRALTILQSPGCVIETHWPTVTLVQPMGVHHASSLSKTCFHTCSQTCKVKASHSSAALTVRQRGHSGWKISLCGRPTMWTPKTKPLFCDSDRHAPPSCHHMPSTSTERAENSFTACSVLQTEGPLINTLLWFCFPQGRNECRGADCWCAQSIARTVDIDSSRLSGSRQPADDPVLGNVVILGSEKPIYCVQAL